MNNTTPNYPYLAGALRSALESLAYDENLFKIKSVEKRMDYLKAIAESANKSAIEYEAGFNAKMSKL
jgi:hypothetical protein